jgi:hypothetical protein
MYLNPEKVKCTIKILVLDSLFHTNNFQAQWWLHHSKRQISKTLAKTETTKTPTKPEGGRTENL